MKTRIHKGRLSSPYFIFLRGLGKFTDADVLKLLGLDHFVAHPFSTDLNKPHIYLTEDDSWIHIADDWFYSLWNRSGYQLLDAVHRRIPEVPIFACSVGDADHSFYFAYYLSGQLIRRYVVEDRCYDKPRRNVVEDFGQPLALEKVLSDIGDEQDYVLSLAVGVGVKINHDLSSVRCYAVRQT
jgi:hypothetical protein